MAEPVLHVSGDLAFPQDAVTQSFALLAVRRAGKSNAGAVLAEEMYDAGLPWVVIDPKGDWWGLRSSMDGTGPGLPIPIFGGLHGDMPLVPEAGALMADLVVEHNLTCVLDVSRFSKAARVRFLTAFAERLFTLHQADPQPRHVFLEEADRIVPQRVMQDMAACVGAWSDLVRLGGAFGLGVTIISQRSAVVNKDLLTQVEVMIALRTTSPQDRKAIRDWMEHHAIADEIVDSLPGLPSGEAWVSSSYWLTEHGHPAIQRIRFRRRATFDSGATPKVGQQRRPATLADIDLTALQGRMEAVVEKATLDDPKALRRRIADLERRLAAKGREAQAGGAARIAELEAALAGERARPPERAEVPVFANGDLAALRDAVQALRDVAGGVESAMRAVSGSGKPIQPGRALAGAPTPPVRPPAVAVAPARILTPAPAPASGGEAPALGKAHRAILAVLAQFPDGRSIRQVAMLTGYSAKGGGFRSALGALRTGGFINRSEPVQITPEGLDVLGGNWEPLPAGTALVEHWMGQLGRAERSILAALLAAWPESMTAAQIGAVTGYSDSGGGFRNALGRLRTLQLIDGYGEIRADETLAQHAREVAHA